MAKVPHSNWERTRYRLPRIAGYLTFPHLLAGRGTPSLKHLIPTPRLHD